MDHYRIKHIDVQHKKVLGETWTSSMKAHRLWSDSSIVACTPALVDLYLEFVVDQLVYHVFSSFNKTNSFQLFQDIVQSFLAESFQRIHLCDELYEHQDNLSNHLRLLKQSEFLMTE